MARPMGATVVCYTQPLVFYAGRSSAAYPQRVRTLTPQARPNIVKAKSSRAKSAEPRSVGPAKILGYSAPKLVQPSANGDTAFPMRQLSGSEFPVRQLSGSEFPVRQLSGSEFPMRQLSGSEFPMRQLSGSEFPVRQISGPEFPMRQLSGSEFPMRQLSGSEFPVRQLSGSDFPMRQLSGSEFPTRQINGSYQAAVTVQRTAPSFVSPRSPKLDDCYRSAEPQFSAKITSSEDKITDAVKAPAYLDDDESDDKVKPCFMVVDNSERQFTSELIEPEGETARERQLTSEHFLKTYSAVVRKRVADTDFVRLGLDFLLDKREQLEHMKLEDQRWYENEAKPSLAQAFKLHDTGGTGMLNKSEAHSFYSSLITKDSEVAAAFASIAMEHSIRTQMLMMLSMIPQEFWEGYQEKQTTYERMMQDAVQQAVDAAKHDATNRMEIYKKLKDEHDAAAFKVMDANGDGEISFEEFLAVFNPNSSKQTDFMLALGFITAKEKIQYQQAMMMQREGLFADQ